MFGRAFTVARPRPVTVYHESAFNPSIRLPNLQVRFFPVFTTPSYRAAIRRHRAAAASVSSLLRPSLQPTTVQNGVRARTRGVAPPVDTTREIRNRGGPWIETPPPKKTAVEIDDPLSSSIKSPTPRQLCISN